MLGDVLRRNISLLSNATTKKSGENAFWVILRNIATKEIIEYGGLVDSDTIIPLYYDIMSKNLSYIPEYFQQILPSNKQERFRVIIRNLFSSNAFHPDGLAMQEGIHAFKEINEEKKGKRIIYSKG